MEAASNNLYKSRHLGAKPEPMELCLTISSTLQENADAQTGTNIMLMKDASFLKNLKLPNLGTCEIIKMINHIACSFKLIS
jgi:hypothetical protein